jgi:hypothetical protein
LLRVELDRDPPRRLGAPAGLRLDPRRRDAGEDADGVWHGITLPAGLLHAERGEEEVPLFVPGPRLLGLEDAERRESDPSLAVAPLLEDLARAASPSRRDAEEAEEAGLGVALGKLPLGDADGVELVADD